MLKSLTIKNYAIIDNLTIDFNSGFNVFTGETGAGKSIIVGALTFLLKGRSDSSVIKNGKDKAIIEGVFETNNSYIINKLKEQDIDVDREIIVKRVISFDNRNSIKINESNVTLNFLTELFADFVDVHSQKDSHYLFNKKNQLNLLDKFADNSNLLLNYSCAFNKYQKTKQEYDDLLNNEYNESEIEYLKFDLKELEEANLDEEEEREYELKESRYKKSEKYIQSLKEAIDLYDSNYGIKENLYNLFNGLNIDDEQIISISSKIKDIYYELDENIDLLKDILSSFIDSDTNIEEVEERLYLYSKLKRKHKTDTKGLIELTNEIRNKLALYNDRENVLNAKLLEVNNSLNVVKELAIKLHNSRISASKELSNQIVRESNDLLLNNLDFTISFSECEYNSLGNDEIEFMVSLNKGEDLKPLRNVASGGEISRLMLALKVVFSKLLNTDLLILDEIDSGVSGKVALAVGEKISKISRSVQVICISHLAPVAACANSHYLIYKQDNDTSTYTNVKELNQDELIEQLAIISNTSTDKKAIDAARELYNTCQKIANEN